MDWGKHVKYLRESKGLSQGKLAKMIGWHHDKADQNISGIETGRTALKMDVAESIAKALGMTLSEFVKPVDAPLEDLLGITVEQFLALQPEEQVARLEQVLTPAQFENYLSGILSSSAELFRNRSD